MLGGCIFLVLLLATLAFRVRVPALGWREASLYAAVTWGAGVGLLTEVLSWFHALRFWPVLIVWSGAIVALGAYVGKVGWREKAWRWSAPGTPLEWALAAGLAALLALAGAAAVGAPPATPDVLSYHLPRQLLWLEQGGVQHFATISDRLLMMSPLAEMIQVHALLLAGGDGWANVPQWLAYAWGMVATSLLARELGAGRAGQWLAAFVFATVPMAYLEASSAKNDLLVAVWLGVFTWLALRPVTAGRRTTADWAALGAALGLALATKTTAVIFVVPVLVWLGRAFAGDRRGVLVVVAAVLLIAGPHWARNQGWYGTPLGVHRAEDGGAQGNEVFSWRSVASNVARNATLHLATPSPEVNARLRAVVVRAHELIGQDVSDARTTLLGMDYGVEWWPKFESSAGAPAQVWLGLAVALAVLVRGPRRGRAGALLAIAAAGLLLYCLVLKWQPWGARLQLPLFVWFAALTAWWAERAGGVAGWGAAGIVAVGWLPSAEVSIRPLWTSPTVFATGRWENYFRTHPEDQRSAEACLAAIAVARVESLQVVFKHGFPYAVMRRYLDEGGGRRRLWVPGSVEKEPAAPPQAVLVMERYNSWIPLYLRPDGAKERFRAVGATDPFGLYVPESLARALALADKLSMPSFVGWDQATGFGALEPGRAGDAVIAVRRMNAPVLALGFRVEAARMAVRVEAMNPGTAACDVELRLNGARIAGVRFEPGAGLQLVEVPMGGSGERGELTLRVVGVESEARPALVFTKLQIVDW